MDFLIEHLELSANELFPVTGDEDIDRIARLQYVETFEAGAKPRPARTTFFFRMETGLVLAAIDRVLRMEHFDLGAGADFERGEINASFDRVYDRRAPWLDRLILPQSDVRLSLKLHIEVAEKGETLLITSNRLPSWIRAFEQQVKSVLDKTPKSALRLWQVLQTNGIAQNPVLPPGKPLEAPFAGTLRDYSGCARNEELADLRSGILPLGRYAFGDPRYETVEYGDNLFLGIDDTDQPMINKGALICAPQNSGKTRLIVRWAKAANLAGDSLVVVDVKGNLRDQLINHLKGDVYHVTTDPEDLEGDGIDLISGIDFRTPLGQRRLRQLIDALMPRSGWNEGEHAYFYQNHVNWFTGLMNILLLYQNYFVEHFGKHGADLSHLYELATSEQQLYRCIDAIRVAESSRTLVERTRPTIDFWTTEIALLVSRKKGGQRTDQYTYRSLTNPIVNALRPFSVNGTLFSKTSRRAPGGLERKFFDFNLLRQPREPITLILAAREQDIEDAEVLATVAIKRLEHVLFDRMSGKLLNEKLPTILLLLDETRRIRSFSPVEYVTFARQARAGCVLVYQSIDQVGDDTSINVLLENIGTQIYLGALTGKTARSFVSMLPRRFRPQYSTTTSSDAGILKLGSQTGLELVDYFSTTDLYRLPGGQYPALIYINDLSRRLPFLVDMYEPQVPDETANQIV